MEVITPIRRALEDEHVIGVDPKLKPDLPGVWRRRIHAFTGRAISDKALTAEQEMRSGLQRLQGLTMTAGIVSGLDVAPDRLSIGAAPGQARLRVGPGFGLARSGEDIAIGAARQVGLASLPIVVPVTIADALRGAGAAAPPATTVVGAPSPGPDRFAIDEPIATRLVTALPRKVALTLGEAIDKPAAADLPRCAILVAQPVNATILPRLGDDCPPDPRDDPYCDLQQIDGCRLVLFFWPSEMVARTAGPDYSYPLPGPGQRSRLAWRIFDLEAISQGEEMHPWEAFGLPLALIGFDQDWKLEFVDRAAVVRKGGAPLPRTPLVPQSGTPQLWQARIEQLVEHMGSLPDLDAATLHAALTRVPPAGVLPASCYDPFARRQHFFPAGFALSAVPIPRSNLDLAIRDAALLAPINPSVPDRVELLIPVPDPMYEPGLLEVATVDPAFAAAIDAFGEDRGHWLARRGFVRRRYERLMESVSGVALGWPAVASPPEEAAPHPGDTPPDLARTRRFAAGAATKVHSVTTTATLTVAPGDTLWLWLKVHDAAGLTGLSLRLSAAESPGAFAPGVFWGEATGLPIAAANAGSLPARRVGDLPGAGVWTKLAIPADREWQPAGGTLASLKIAGVEFAQLGGDIEFGAFGKTDAQGGEITWIADEAPGSAVFHLDNPQAAVEWPWTDVAGRDYAGLGEFGTARDGNSRKVVVIETFKSEWDQPFLAADMARLEEVGIDAYLGEVEGKINASNDAIDLGFLRARSDIYRVRQFMLGADSASRLVTSPSLADLALRDEGARATSEGISKFIEAVRIRKAEGVAFQSPPPAPPTGPAPPSPPRPPREVAIDNTRFRASVMTNNVFARIAAQPSAFAAAGLVSTTVSTAKPAFDAASLFQPSAGLTLQPLQLELAAPVVTLTPQANFAASLLASRIAADSNRYVPKDVRAQRPLPGLIERTISVAERLKPAPAVQALEFAIASKAAVLQTLRQLMESAAASNGATRPPGVPLGDLGVPGFGIVKNGAPPPTLDLLFADQKADSRNYGDIDVLLGQSDSKHESDYFTAAVNAIDNAIAMMRLVEGRIALYESLAGRARATRDEILGLTGEAAAQLRSIDTEVEEARHDIATAQMLLAEETARVETLNARRSATLADHVPVIAYRRVRECQHRSSAPSQELLAGLAPPPLAACRRDHPDTPDELKRFAALLGEAPVKWFPRVAAEVSRIDRIEAARNALDYTRLLAGAAQALAFEPRAVASSKGTARFLGGAIRAMHAQQQTLVARRLASFSAASAAVASLTLSEAHTQLRETASLGDLAAGKHRHGALTALASAELVGTLEIAACLHAGFAGVAPVIRLAWAEILSEFDRPADLHSLAGLPRWGEVPREIRHNLQGLVDFLFGRIDRTSDKAVTFFNDLVRAAMLLAAHSPVDLIIQAQLVAEAPARIGSRLVLDLDPKRVRKGMFAHIRDAEDRLIAKAVIDDIGDGRAGARIVANFIKVAAIVPSMRVVLTADAGRLR